MKQLLKKRKINKETNACLGRILEKINELIKSSVFTRSYI